MAKAFSIVFMCLLNLILSAQQPEIEWGKSFGGTSWENINSMTIDAQGNSYITGYFYGKSDFDPSSDSAYITSLGSADAFVQKLDRDGNIVWVVTFGGVNDQVGYSICVDFNGNVIVTGTLDGTADFDPDTANNFVLNPLGVLDCFVVKLDNDGTFLWANSIGASGSYVYGYGIDSDILGNLYVTGPFNNTVDFDPGTGNVNLSSNGNFDMFLQKLNPSGSLVWAKSWGGSSFDYTSVIDVNDNGEIFLGGIFSGSVNFDPGVGTEILTSKGSQDVFTQKLDSSGNFVWANSIGGILGDRMKSIIVDENDNVYVTGYFYDTLMFNSGGEQKIATNGLTDVFLQKSNSDGTIDWVRTLGGISYDYANDLAIDDYGNVFLAGSFRNTVDFDYSDDSLKLTSVGAEDSYVQKLDSSGNMIWTLTDGGDSTDFTKCLNIYLNIEIIIGGYFYEPIALTTTAGLNTLLSKGGSDIYVLKYTQCSSDSILLSNDSLFPVVKNCSIDSIVVPTATNECGDLLYGKPNVNFPIEVPGKTIITWNFSDKQGNVNSQKQEVFVGEIVKTTSQNGFVLTANASKDHKFQWLYCDSNFTKIEGETNQSFIPAFNGTYAVEISSGSCSVISNCYPIESVGFNEKNNFEQYKVFPNPTNQNIHVFLDDLKKDYKFILRDLFGKEVFNMDVRNINSYQFNIDETKGIYFLEISTPEMDKQIIKIIKN